MSLATYAMGGAAVAFLLAVAGIFMRSGAYNNRFYASFASGLQEAVQKAFAGGR